MELMALTIATKLQAVLLCSSDHSCSIPIGLYLIENATTKQTRQVILEMVQSCFEIGLKVSLIGYFHFRFVEKTD